jgi:hypothetical protein
LEKGVNPLLRNRAEGFARNGWEMDGHGKISNRKIGNEM